MGVFLSCCTGLSEVFPETAAAGKWNGTNSHHFKEPKPDVDNEFKGTGNLESELGANHDLRKDN